MIIRFLASFCLFSIVYCSSSKNVAKPKSIQFSSGECQIEYETINPLGPVVECSFLPDSFVECDEPQGPFGPAAHNDSNMEYGKCSKMGGARIEDVEFTNVVCQVLDCIPCQGPRVFLREVPCIKYTGHYFLSTLLYSVLLGVAGVDRFCLGYSAMAVGKMMTIGGFGVWWIVDIFLLVFGVLQPADDSNWEPYY